MKRFFIFTVLSLNLNILVGQSLTDSLKAYYPFENNYIDSSLNSNDLMLNSGGLLFTQRAVNNKAVLFNGTSSLRTVNLFNNTNYTECSISFWIRTNSAKNTRQIVLQGAFLGFGQLIDPFTNKIRGWFDSSASGAIASLDSINDGLWHHVVHQTNGAFTDLYIDGILNVRISESLVTGSGGLNEYIYLGTASNGTERYTGELDEVRIYNRVLSGIEITTLSQPPLTTSLSQEDNSSNNLSIYPNPTNSRIFFTANKELLNATVYLRNIQGQIVQERVISQLGKQSFNLENEVSGVYFIETNSGGEIKIVKKIIKY